MSQVYNKSREVYEKAEQVKCPRCRGFGRVTDDIDQCLLCNGYGTTWKSVENSGWYRPLYARVANSILW